MSIKRYDYKQRPEKGGMYVLYTDHIASLEAVKATVKALEWSNFASPTWTGDGIGLRYYVYNDGGDWIAYTEGYEADRLGVFPSADAGKAAADADFTRRVLSAIVPSPALEANRLADKIEDLIEEFGDDPKAALDCISEWISFSRHNSASALSDNPKGNVS